MSFGHTFDDSLRPIVFRSRHDTRRPSLVTRQTSESGPDPQLDSTAGIAQRYTADQEQIVATIRGDREVCRMASMFSSGSRTWQGAIAIACLIGTASCSSIKITNRDEYRGEKLARPDRILVHDFAAHPDDLPAWSEAARANQGSEGSSHARVSADEAEVGRQLGIEMARALVKRIDEMGLQAERAAGARSPADGDIVIVGYLASVEEGSGFKRVVIGFGSGAAEVTTHVEGYLATSEGMRKLGSGDASSGKGRGPGVVVPLAVTIATANPIGLIVMTPIKVGSEITGRNTVEGVGKRMADTIADALEEKFREQGWIDR